MFDRVMFSAKLSDAECEHIAKIHGLQTWSNGACVEYRTERIDNITGINIKIKNRKLKMSLSLHKYWNRSNFGKLRNDNTFTISEARSAFEMVCFENGLLPERVTITNYEIGLNLNVSSTPINYIHKTVNFATKAVYIDANYRPNRQRTSEKYDDIRKYFKMYDKGFEMASKEFGSKRAAGMETSNILRIETVYRRCTYKATDFFTERYINTILNRFYLDWQNVIFFREIRADKGARKSEIEMARMIYDNGVANTADEARKAFKDKKITQKQCRTITDFCKKWGLDSKKHFYQIVSFEEQEYKTLFYSTLKLCRE